MEKIEWINGVTKLNKTTLDKFQDNIETAIDEVNDTIGDIDKILKEING